VVPSVTDDEAKELYPLGVTPVSLLSGKGYLCFTADPRTAEKYIIGVKFDGRR
jgi:hypothetical protein